MNRFNLLKKILIFTISWTLCLSPIASETTNQTDQTVQEESVTSSGTMTSTHPADPTYCYNDPSFAAKRASCEKEGLQINCHLNVCAKSQDNAIYNKEYMDCELREESQRQACREDLKSVGQQIAANDQNMNSSTGGAGNLGMITTVGATVGLGCAIYTGSCPTDFGLMLTGVVGLALAFMAMQSGQLKKQLDQAKKQLKANDQKDVKNWSAQTQVATLTQQIAAIDMIIKAAKDKAKKHQTVAFLAAAVGTVALLCAAASMFGCTSGNPCAYFAAGAGFVVMGMEIVASNESMEVASKWEKNKEIAVKLKNKIESLYKINGASMAQMNGANAGANLSVKNGQAINLGGGVNAQNEQGLFEQGKDEKQCVSSDMSAGACPCKEGSCNKIAFQIPKTGIGAQVAERINFGDIQNAANEAFNGDSAKLDAMATPKNLAVMDGIKNKLIKHILDKDLAKGREKDKALLNALLDPNKNKDFLQNHIASNSSPLRAAAYAHKFGLKNYDTNSPDSSLAVNATEVPEYTDSSFKENLKKIEDQLNLDDLNGNIGANLSDTTNATNTANNTITESEEILGSQINPEKQMNLFKIISNRYNIIRVKKRIGN